uniref:AIG1-type G domain-containing protein n=1 Tax=Seriola dumerili TaxID=41447 RepID=A0A3B4VA71_SERDU
MINYSYCSSFVGLTEAMPLRIMLFGKSGAGKSLSGNTILCRQAFESGMKLTRVTQHCEKKVVIVENVPVTVIDTPGIFAKDGDQKTFIREILQSVKLQEPGPHAFVYEDQHTYNLMETMFGPRVWDYAIVLFAHGDCLQGKTINDIITESNDNLRDFICKCNGGFHVFNSKNPAHLDQVTSFLAKIQTLVALNGGKHYHKGLYPAQEREIRERQESILKERDEENHQPGGRSTKCRTWFISALFLKYNSWNRKTFLAVENMSNTLIGLWKYRLPRHPLKICL